MLARGAIHNPKVFNEYKNLNLEEFLLKNNDLDLELENDYEEIPDDDNIVPNINSSNKKSDKTTHSSKKINNDDETDLRVSNKLSKIFEKKYTNTHIDIVPTVKEYLELALKTGNNFKNSKYNILYILKTHKNHMDLFKKIQNSKSFEELSTFLEMKETYEAYVNMNENMKAYYDSSYFKDNFKKRNNDIKDKNNIEINI
jgi:tRNA-dihydrouridine synthase